MSLPLVRGWKEALHIDRVLIPSRKRRILLYLLLLPIGIFGFLYGVTGQTAYVLLFLSLLGLNLSIWVNAANRYILSRDPMRE